MHLSARVFLLSTLLLCVGLAGCASKPRRPNWYPAMNYPYAKPTDLRAGYALKLEALDTGLDGGSHVYIFSTPEKRKLVLWDLCQLAKLELGHPATRNSFILVWGSSKGAECPVEPGSELEKTLISNIKPTSLLALHIIEGLKDRSWIIDRSDAKPLLK
jgi:hypothetical protein